MQADVVWQELQGSLAVHHLHVKIAKTVLYSGNQTGPQHGPMVEHLSAQPCSQGLVLCGFPTWHQDAEGDDRPAVPVVTLYEITSCLSTCAFCVPTTRQSVRGRGITIFGLPPLSYALTKLIQAPTAHGDL
eukprot:5993126-Amphidinium_carterae.3